MGEFILNDLIKTESFAKGSANALVVLFIKVLEFSALVEKPKVRTFESKRVGDVELFETHDSSRAGPSICDFKGAPGKIEALTANVHDSGD
jgi:hypothetical protein